MNVNNLKLNDPNFPRVLATINYPPQEIFWAGQHPSEWLGRPRVAIVGSRKISSYGRQTTNRLATELAGAGVVIISGLAYGVDVAAHQAALAAGGTTVAALPSSLDEIYPAAHSGIARQIIDKGSLVTEYPLGSSIAFKSNFIARNRIISGLADVVLIPEAALKSGSLHTARFAMEQGKTVMAVPGNINSPTSEGCNNLIKSGAVPVTDCSDIFFALKISPPKPEDKIFSGNPQEESVYRLIMQGVSAQEDLAAAAKVDASAVSGALTMLELSGYIRPAGSGHWVIS